MAAFMPNKIITREPGDKAWFNEQCRKAVTEQRQLYLKMQTLNDLASKQVSPHKSGVQSTRKTSNETIEPQTKEGTVNNSLSSKKWCGIVKLFSGRNGSTDMPVIEHQGIPYISANKKANIFCQTFADNCTLPGASAQPQLQCLLPSSYLGNIHFKPKDLSNILHNLDPGKASGPDEVPM